MVDVESHHFLTEPHVVLGVKNEGVPCDVNQGRWRVSVTGVLAAEQQKTNRLIEQDFCPEPLYILTFGTELLLEFQILRDANDEAVPEAFIQGISTTNDQSLVS